MLHRQYPSVEYYIEHMQRYSSASVPLLLRKGRTSASIFAFAANTVVNPALTFIKNYIFRGGFLDGREGLIFHLNHSAYVNWKFSKAWEAHRAAAAPTDRVPTGQIPSDRAQADRVSTDHSAASTGPARDPGAR